MTTPTPKPVLKQPKFPKKKKSEKIEVITRASIDPEYVVILRTTYPIVVLQNKRNVVAPRNLLLRAAVYDIFRHNTVGAFQEARSQNAVKTFVWSVRQR